ncbi:MAG: type I methionyl aminopeptidase [Geminicoccaceae bacterium]
MTVTKSSELEGLKAIGGIVAETLQQMGSAIEPGMTTRELDDIGRQRLERQGARPAPELVYGFPGATCISVNHVIAHGIPCEQVIGPGDLVNIDVSAEKDGFFADTGASFIVPPTTSAKTALCRATRKARDRAVRRVKAGKPLNVIGRTIEQAAERQGYSIIRNLQSHGVGRTIHEEPKSIPQFDAPFDRRILEKGMVITVEPFLSTGAWWAEDGGDDWSLVTDPKFMTAQYEHTLVVTERGAIVVT